MTSPTTADLVRQASEQISTLVRDEIKLAQAELTDKGRHAAQGTGMLAGAGIVAAYALGALLLTAGLALALVLPAWLSALIVGVVLLLVAGVLALIAKKHFRRVPPLAPRHAVKSVQADVNAVTDAIDAKEAWHE